MHRFAIRLAVAMCGLVLPAVVRGENPPAKEPWSHPAPKQADAPARRPVQPAPGQVDLSAIRRQVMEYVEAQRLAEGPFGAYRDGLHAQGPSLYASCDVAHLRTVMGEDLQRCLASPERRDWIAHINSFAWPDGSYRPARRNHSPQHANGMVIGALGVLGGRQAYPVRLYDEFDTVEEVGPWLSRLDWEKQWSGSHLLWGGMHCFSMSARCGDAWRNAVFDWLDANLDPQTGWWRRGVAPARPVDPLGGGAHIWPIYQHHGRRFPYPERLLDSILALQKPDGSWLRFGNYLDMDALYGIGYLRTLVPNYRRDDVRAAIAKHGQGLTEQWPKFMAGQPDLHTLLGAVGAWGLLNQLAPSTYADTARWSDIFSDRRLYQTAAVEVLPSPAERPH